MQEFLMDILRTLSTPIMDIQKKTLEIALDLITVRNIDEVILPWNTTDYPTSTVTEVLFWFNPDGNQLYTRMRARKLQSVKF